MDVFVRDLATGKTAELSVSSRGVQAGCKGWCESTQPVAQRGRPLSSRSSPRRRTSSPETRTSSPTCSSTTAAPAAPSASASPARASRPGADRTNNGSNAPSISGDGRYVAFHSADSNLVPGDTNRTFDIFVHDRKTGRTTRVSVSSAGRQANGENVGAPSFSADGRYVAFNSLATNLVPGDTKDNDILDVFVRDLRAGTTTIASVGAAGQHGGDSSSVSGHRVQQ